MAGHAAQSVPAMGRLLSALTAVALLAGAAPRPAAVEKTPFKVEVRGLTFTDKVASLTLLPGEGVTLSVAGDEGPYRVEAEAGVVTRRAGAFRWQAPDEPGLVTLKVQDAKTRTAQEINVFVLVPFARVQAGRLNGYQIGTYPAKTQPDGFVIRRAGGAGTCLPKAPPCSRSG